MTSSGSTHDPARPTPASGHPIPGPVAPLLLAHLAQADGQVVLTLTGDIDLATAGIVRAAVCRCLRERPARLLLDMRSVGFCDVAGVRALQSARREAATIPAEFGIIAPRPPVIRIFTLMDAGDLLSTAQGFPHSKGETSVDGSTTLPDSGLDTTRAALRVLAPSGVRPRPLEHLARAFIHPGS